MIVWFFQSYYFNNIFNTKIPSAVGSDINVVDNNNVPNIPTTTNNNMVHGIEYNKINMDIKNHSTFKQQQEEAGDEDEDEDGDDVVVDTNLAVVESQSLSSNIPNGLNRVTVNKNGINDGGNNNTEINNRNNVDSSSSDDDDDDDDEVILFMGRHNSICV